MTLAYVQDGEMLTVPCPAAGATLGDWLAIGGLVGQAQKTTTSGLDLELYCPKVGDIVRMTKVTGIIPVAGEVAFFDFGTDQRLEAYSTQAGLRPVGFYEKAALTGDTAARVRWDPAAAEAALVRVTLSILLDAGIVQAKTTPFIAPFAGKIVGLAYYIDGKPTSAAGAALLTAINASVSDNTLISTANINLETATEDAVTAMTLSSTAADLVLAKGAVAEFVATPDNADIVAGTGIHIQVVFQRT